MIDGPALALYSLACRFRSQIVSKWPEAVNMGSLQNLRDSRSHAGNIIRLKELFKKKKIEFSTLCWSRLKTVLFRQQGIESQESQFSKEKKENILFKPMYDISMGGGLGALYIYPPPSPIDNRTVS